MADERIQAPADEGVGLDISARRDDCSGLRPSWYPFQINVCDEDADDFDPLPTARHRELPASPALPPWHP